MSQSFHTSLLSLSSELEQRFNSQYKIKLMLWERMRFAADVLNGRNNTAFDVKRLGPWLDEVLQAATDMEDFENAR